MKKRPTPAAAIAQVIQLEVQPQADVTPAFHLEVAGGRLVRSGNAGGAQLTQVKLTLYQRERRKITPLFLFSDLCFSWHQELSSWVFEEESFDRLYEAITDDLPIDPWTRTALKRWWYKDHPVPSYDRSFRVDLYFYIREIVERALTDSVPADADEQNVKKEAKSSRIV